MALATRSPIQCVFTIHDYINSNKTIKTMYYSNEPSSVFDLVHDFIVLQRSTPFGVVSFRVRKDGFSLNGVFMQKLHTIIDAVLSEGVGEIPATDLQYTLLFQTINEMRKDVDIRRNL